MKIADGFILQNVAGENIVVPIEEKSLSFKAMITLNEPGAFLWGLLQVDRTKSDLVYELINRYDIDELTADKDVDDFLQKLMDIQVLENS
ncbi:MAG: PqqD family protein [Clostridia bacterium]